MGKSARQHQIQVTVTCAAVLLGCVMCASPTTRPAPGPTATPSPTPLATVDSQTYGALLYVDGRVVREGWGEATDRQITALPFEQVLAATLEHDSRLWALADGRLAVVDLPGGTTEEVAKIESITPQSQTSRRWPSICHSNPATHIVPSGRRTAGACILSCAPGQ